MARAAEKYLLKKSSQLPCTNESDEDEYVTSFLRREVTLMGDF
jgi:hypothetical protein